MVYRDILKKLQYRRKRSLAARRKVAVLNSYTFLIQNKPHDLSAKDTNER